MPKCPTDEWINKNVLYPLPMGNMVDMCCTARTLFVKWLYHSAFQWGVYESSVALLSSQYLVVPGFCFELAILMGVQWYFIVAFISIFLMAKDAEHLLIGLFAIHIFLGERSVQVFCPYFGKLVFFIVTYFGYKCPIWCILQIFSAYLWLFLLS